LEYVAPLPLIPKAEVFEFRQQSADSIEHLSILLIVCCLTQKLIEISQPFELSPQGVSEFAGGCDIRIRYLVKLPVIRKQPLRQMTGVERDANTLNASSIGTPLAKIIVILAETYSVGLWNLSRHEFLYNPFQDRRPPPHGSARRELLDRFAGCPDRVQEFTPVVQIRDVRCP
jgi:hypothetical protein